MKTHSNQSLRIISISTILATMLVTANVNAHENGKRKFQRGENWQQCENDEDCQSHGKKGGSKGDRGPRFQQINNLEDANEVAQEIKSRFQDRMDKLKERLQITSEQESIWANYLSVSSANLPSPESILERANMREAGNTPENQKKRFAERMTHMQNMGNQIAAYETLYNAVTSEQQEILKNTRIMQNGKGKGGRGGKQGKGSQKDRNG